MDFLWNIVIILGSVVGVIVVVVSVLFLVPSGDKSTQKSQEEEEKESPKKPTSTRWEQRVTTGLWLVVILVGSTFLVMSQRGTWQTVIDLPWWWFGYIVAFAALWGLIASLKNKGLGTSIVAPVSLVLMALAVISGHSAIFDPDSEPALLTAVYLTVHPGANPLYEPKVRDENGERPMNNEWCWFSNKSQSVDPAHPTKKIVARAVDGKVALYSTLDQMVTLTVRDYEMTPREAQWKLEGDPRGRCIPNIRDALKRQGRLP